MSRLKRKVERLRKKLEKLAPARAAPPSGDVRSLTPPQRDRLEALLVLACDGPRGSRPPDPSRLTETERRELYALMDRVTPGPPPPAD